MVSDEEISGIGVRPVEDISWLNVGFIWVMCGLCVDFVQPFWVVPPSPPSLTPLPQFLVSVVAH